MEEKVLIKSQPYSVKKYVIILILLGFLLSVYMFVSDMTKQIEYYESECYEIYIEHQNQGYCNKRTENECWRCREVKKWGSGFAYAFHYMTDDSHDIIYIAPIAVAVLIDGLIFLLYLWNRSYELTVTDKRVYGKIAWGKRVDLPLDAISATATIRLMKGVSVSTASGVISFCAIKNADEIYNVISNLLIERQQNISNINTTTIPVAPMADEADMIKKYKDLLDCGAITQEEFDAKKKQILGL